MRNKLDTYALIAIAVFIIVMSGVITTIFYFHNKFQNQVTETERIEYLNDNCAL